MSKRSEHHVNILSDWGVDLSSGRLFLAGEVSESMYVRLTTGLAILTTQSSVKRHTLVLNTLGGDVYQALAIYDAIRIHERPVDILVNGPCLSAGVIILQAAQGRAATPSSYFMVHEGNEAIEGESATVHRTIKHFEKLNEYTFDLINARLRVPSDRLSKWMSRDKYFNAKEALAVGLIDKIVGNK
jgi:ATP-dependent Clp protease, protease subunit